MSKISFFSNYINHHQLPFCKEMVKLTNNNFYFVSQKAISEKRIALGYKNISNDYPFVVKTYESKEELSKAFDLANNSDCVVFGATKDYYFKDRIKANKLTLEYSERLNKKRQNIIDWLISFGSVQKHRGLYKNKNLYLLCSGMYVAGDYNEYGVYKNKTYKWGYFPELLEYDLNELFDKKNNKITKILWAGRLIDWKHPELIIELAKRLKENNREFEINIIGQGILEDDISNMIIDNDLSNEVYLLGSMSPQEVRKNMEESNIYLLTSDYGEGWGAVLNEAMNSGCACVCSHAVGAAGFLIKDKTNGLIFRNQDISDLYEKVLYLIDNKEDAINMGTNAYKTILETWNAKEAAKRLMTLIECLNNKKPTPFIDGPCSIAYPIKEKDVYTYITK